MSRFLPGMYWQLFCLGNQLSEIEKDLFMSKMDTFDIANETYRGNNMNYM